MARLTIRDRATGRVKLDSSTATILFFGSLTIGGAGSPQSGSITDPRFSWGEGVAFVLQGGFVGTDGYEAVISITNTTLVWEYPRAGSSASERAPTTFLYGVLP